MVLRAAGEGAQVEAVRVVVVVPAVKVEVVVLEEVKVSEC